MATSIGTPISVATNVSERSLAWLTLRLAEINSPDILQSVSTGGSTTTLADSVSITQPNDHWNGGTLWILSGGFAGTVKKLTDSALSGSTVTFAALTSAMTAGINYFLCNQATPYSMLKMSINHALRELLIEKVDKTLVGVNGTYEYALPVDVTRVTAVDLVRDDILYKSTHWSETDEGDLRFDRGFSPRDDDEIWVHYLQTHPDLEDTDEELDDQVIQEVFMVKATEKLLRLLYHRFGKDQKELPEWLADAMNSNKAARSVTRKANKVIVHTSGW
jgi:hypothetical protein